MHDAKTQLSRLVDLALAGEEIVIARRSKPLVRLEVVRQTASRRQIGTLPGLITCMNDDFNASMDDWDEGISPRV